MMKERQLRQIQLNSKDLSDFDETNDKFAKTTTKKQ